MEPEVMVALVGLVALVLYALLGGADFGAGIWVLLARGPRAEAQQQAIAHAMGPVWEANHVWLIFLIVLLFSCFPPAFAALSVAFFVPLHLVLLGIVLRGAAFVFRAHGSTVERPNSHWTRLFGVASAFTPLVLGLCLAAISSGRFRFSASGHIDASGFWSPWLSPFAWTLGLFALAICAYLAAVYLTLESEEELQEDFRRRALGAGAVMAVLAVLTLVVARLDAPRFWSQMLHPQAAPVLAGAGLLGLASTGAVLRRRYVWGRAAAVGQVTLVVLGWGIAQHPYLIYPDFPLNASAAPDPTLHLVLWSLIPGGLLLGPSLWLLFRVFKGGGPAVSAPHGSG